MSAAAFGSYFYPEQDDKKKCDGTNLIILKMIEDCLRNCKTMMARVLKNRTFEQSVQLSGVMIYSTDLFS